MSKPYHCVPPPSTRCLNLVTGTVCTSAIIVIAASVHYIVTELTQDLFLDEIRILPIDTPDTLALLNVAVAGLTILTVPVM